MDSTSNKYLSIKHHVKIASKILNIELMYLPEYSPDLQPIEDLWKIIKSIVYLNDLKI